MRLTTRWVTIITLILGCVCTSQGTDIRIMPLGDSITESSDGHASYRYWLWHDLLDAGFEVDFVGTMSGVHNGAPLYPDFDQDHEGHWGWRADHFLTEIGWWSRIHEPEIALVHLGHNDLWQGNTIASTIDELGLIIDELRDAVPTVIVLLAQVIPGEAGIGLDSIPHFNAQIPTLAAAKHTAESPVLIVDQHTGFDPDLDTWDGVHPNESGELKMAARWFEQLSAVLTNAAVVGPGPATPRPDIWLSPPQPNPSTAEVRIAFDLHAPGHVRLSVHDLTGRAIAWLVNERMDSGQYTKTWNALGANGERVPAGIYYAHLTAGRSTQRTKLLLVHR